jgi:lysozyme
MRRRTIISAALSVLASSSLIVGAAGVGTIQRAEGKRYKTYLDAVGIPTVCYGHTDDNLRMGMSFSQQECDLLLVADMARANEQINHCTSAPLTGNQRDALISFVFNVGGGAYCKSTLHSLVNQKRHTAASKEFGKWVYASGGRKPIKLAGLVARRKDEAKLFTSTAAWKPYELKRLLVAYEGAK